MSATAAVVAATSVSTRVFIPDSEFVWVTGEVMSQYSIKSKEGNEIYVADVKVDDPELPREKQGTRQVVVPQYDLDDPSHTFPLQNPEMPKEGVQDMCTLSYLHEPSILDNLRRRFANQKPYTFTGDICVALNPYQWLNIYTPELRETYKDKFPHELPPHVYATSAASYRGLTTHSLNQCILVSGESGAGKTETVKILMNHLAFIAGKQDDKTVDKLLKANPLLESFGNAKTIRNDNSSRFGKFSQLEFDGQNTLVGSKCVTYLLEKSRVVGQNPNERSYHIMYELLAAPEEIRSNLFLTESNHPGDYYYLANGDLDTTTIEGVSDDDRYINTIAGLQLLNISDDTCGLVAKTLASVLHLGQLSFNIQSESTAGDAAMISPRGSDRVSDRALAACSDLLGVSSDTFMSTMVNRHIEVQGKRLDVPLTLEQAISGRDALAKEIYARLFNWLVLVINFNTSSIANTRSGQYDKNSPRSRLSAYATISLLDIFGFESFNVNRFEQLCINYANEKLQQKFAQDVFKTVQREYLEEGIGLESIAFKDNSDVLDLIDGKPSVISFLTEECKLPKGADISFLSKLSKQFSSHPAFSIPRFSKNAFAITHYAGSVSYNVQGFIDRNKDTLPNNFAEMLVRSNNLLVQRLFMYSNLFANSDTDGFLAGDRERNGIFLLLDPLPEPSITPLTSPSGRPITPMSSKPKAKRVRAGSLNNTFGIEANIEEEDLVPLDLNSDLNTTPITSNSSQSPKGGVSRDHRSATPSIFDTSQIISRMRSASQSGGPTSPPGVNYSRARSGSTSAKVNRSRASSSGLTPIIETMSTSSFMTAETVTMKFQTQLAQLMDMISQTEVHYVRCIKPNPQKSATQFSRALVVEQLRSGGMIAAVKISRAAYPNRLFYCDFIDRYRFLQSPSWHIQEYKRVAYLNDSDKEIIEVGKALILSVLTDLKGGIRQKIKNDAELFQFGYTKIYFSNLFMERLETIRALKYSSFATKIQSAFRRYSCVRVYQEIKSRIIRMQAVMRTYLVISHFKKLRATTIFVQSLVRRVLAKKRFIEAQEYAKLNSVEQARIARIQAEKEEAERQRLIEEAELERIRLEELAAAEEAARLERERLQRELEEENERIRLELEQKEIARRQKEEENERLRIEAEAIQEQLRLDALLKEQQLAQLQQEQELILFNLLQAQSECEKIRVEAMQREATLMEQLQLTSEQLSMLFHEFETKQAVFQDEKDTLKQEAERVTKVHEEASETWREVTESLKVQLSETVSTVEATQQELNREKETWQEREARLKLQLEETEGKVAKTELELVQERETWQQQEERLRVLLLETEDKSVTLLELTQRENDTKLQQISDRHAQIASAIISEKEEYESRLQRAEAHIEVEKRRTRSEMIEKQRSEKAQRDLEEEFNQFKEESRLRFAEEQARRLDAEEKLRVLVECIDGRILKPTPVKSDLAKKFPELLSASSSSSAAQENLMDVSFESVTPSTKTVAFESPASFVDSMALKSLMTILELLSFANASSRASIAGISGKVIPPYTRNSSQTNMTPSMVPSERLRAKTLTDVIPASDGQTVTTSSSESPVTSLDGSDAYMEPSTDVYDGFTLTEEELEGLQNSLMARQEAKESAIEMLTEFMLTSPTINGPPPAPPSDSSKTNSTVPDGYTWTTVELHEDGAESYESQFHAFMRSQLISPESVPVRVLNWSENSVGYIEYNITFMAHLILSKEPMQSFFESMNKKTVEIESGSRKVLSPSKDNVQVTVSRRFSEFASLWSQLKEMRVRVPKLPEKQWLPKFNNRWKKIDFLDSRKDMLNVWLMQLVHSAANMDPIALRAVHVFLSPAFPKRRAHAW